MFPDNALDPGRNGCSPETGAHLANLYRSSLKVFAPDARCQELKRRTFRVLTVAGSICHFKMSL